MRIHRTSILLASVIAIGIAFFAVSTLRPDCGSVPGSCVYRLDPILFLPGYLLTMDTPFVVTGAPGGAFPGETLKTLLLLSFFYWFLYALVISAVVTSIFSRKK